MAIPIWGGMTRAEAEQSVRELVVRYGAAQWLMPDAARLAEAIAVLGQDRVFRIAKDQQQRGGTSRPACHISS